VVWLGSGVSVLVLFWILVIGQLIFNIFFFICGIIPWIREEHKAVPTQLGMKVIRSILIVTGVNREKVTLSVMLRIKDEMIKIGGQIFLELLLLPTLLLCFEMFHCHNVDSESLMVRNLEMTCWTGTHLVYVLFSAITIVTVLPTSLIFASLQNR
jgi:hypothetical protein